MYLSSVSSSLVIARARGLSTAFFDPLIAIWPSCSRVMPYLWTWRAAYCAVQHAAEVAQNGEVHCDEPETRSGRAPIYCSGSAMPPASYTVRKQMTWRQRPCFTAIAAMPIAESCAGCSIAPICHFDLIPSTSIRSSVPTGEKAR